MFAGILQNFQTLSFLLNFGPQSGPHCPESINVSLLLGIALGPAPYLAIALVALSAAISPLMFYQLDLLLEATIAKEGVTPLVTASEAERAPENSSTPAPLEAVPTPK